MCETTPIQICCWPRRLHWWAFGAFIDRSASRWVPSSLSFEYFSSPVIGGSSPGSEAARKPAQNLRTCLFFCWRVLLAGLWSACSRCYWCLLQPSAPQLLQVHWQSSWRDRRCCSWAAEDRILGGTTASQSFSPHCKASPDKYSCVITCLQ